MKKTIKLAVVAALALGATSAFATNGDVLIGLGAKSRGMAGTGIGMSHGAESALVNPALITSVKSTEVSFGGLIFMPDVSYDNGTGAGYKDSAADINIVPEVSLAAKINDNFYAGVGMWGTAGMGVDYRNEQANFKMVTNLQLMQFGIPLAYKNNGLSVAVAPIVQYGALDINFDTNGSNNTGGGVSQDISFGYTLGVSYEISGLTIGAVYKSEIEMEYDKQISTAGTQFGLTLGDKLSIPEEYGIGASYVMGEHTVAIDYKRISYSSAKGYEDFKWDDQDVVALGYEYNAKNWAARLGYNYAKSPISDQGVANTSINTLNILGFPGIVESHYAVGGTYNLTQQASVDLALTYAAENTQEYTASNFPNPGTRQTKVKHSQTGVSIQLTYDF
jgi:long-chain fatty acid transport protein